MVLANYSSRYLILILAFLGQVNSEPIGEVTVIRQGYVKGRYSETRSGRLFVEYFGIPYGKADRFQLPTPGGKWDGILDATYRRPPCIHQLPTMLTQGVEDCLFINVHTPKIHRKYNLKGLPVLAVIHGGFTHWEDQTGHYLGAKYFLDEDVVLVSFNYRLGAFGFLTSGDVSMPANLGLKDQVLALKWIQKNIEFFGGDSEQVTIVGYGAGAASVTLHLLSPMSKGLFSKAIAQSGTALCPWSLIDDSYQSLDFIAAKCNCTDDSSGVIDCLKKVPAETLARESVLYSRFTYEDNKQVDNAALFGPVVEHWMRNWPTEHAFLLDYPANLFANYSEETMSPVPLLIGVNEFDGLTLKMARSSLPWSPYEFKKITPNTFSRVFGYDRKVNASLLADYQDKIIDHYFPKMKNTPEYDWPSIDESAVGRKLFEALTHRNFAQCTRAFIRNHAKHAKVFPYLFFYNKNVSFLDYWRRTTLLNENFFLNKKADMVNGPVFGDELQYFYDLDEMGDLPLIRETYRNKSLVFSKHMVKMWVNFASSGLPSNSDWKSISGGEQVSWFEIGDGKMNTVGDIWGEHLDFWDSLFDLNKLTPLPPLVDKSAYRRKSYLDYGYFDDIIYVDQQGDDDGTGGLFEQVQF